MPTKAQHKMRLEKFRRKLNKPRLKGIKFSYHSGNRRFRTTQRYSIAKAFGYIALTDKSVLAITLVKSTETMH